MYNKFEELKKEVFEKKEIFPNVKEMLIVFTCKIELIMMNDFNISFETTEFLDDRQKNIIDKYCKNYKSDEKIENAMNKIIEYYEEIITDMDVEYSKQLDDEFEYNEYKESGCKMELILNYISLNYGFYNELANELDDFGYLRYNSPKEIFDTFNLLLYRITTEKDYSIKNDNIYTKLVVYGSCFLNELLDLYRYRYFTDKYTFLNYIKDMYETTI